MTRVLEQMCLWLLRPHADVLRRVPNPWTPPYEKTFGVLVRARDERAARALAQSVAGNEGVGVYAALGLPEDELRDDVWLDETYTDCVELTAAGPAGVVLYDRREA